MISQFPDNMHPMTQLSTVILLMQKDSLFFKNIVKDYQKMIIGTIRMKML